MTHAQLPREPTNRPLFLPTVSGIVVIEESSFDSLKSQQTTRSRALYLYPPVPRSDETEPKEREANCGFILEHPGCQNRLLWAWWKMGSRHLGLIILECGRQEV